MKLCLLTAAALSVLVPTLAFAQEAVPPPPPPDPPPAPVVTEQTTSQASGPSWAMVGSGVVIFGLSYVPALVVGASSSLGADQALFVPIAGPWMDFAQRPGCPAAGSCNAETTNKVLLAVDGVFQAIGAITIVSGFLTPAHETPTVRSASTEPTWRLTPASMGAGGYGMQALGTF